MAQKNLKNLLGTKKKIEKKIDEKMIFFVFFEVPTAKNNFPTRIYFLGSEPIFQIIFEFCFIFSFCYM